MTPSLQKTATRKKTTTSKTTEKTTPKTKKKATVKKTSARRKTIKQKPTPEGRKRARKAAKTAHENNRNPIRPDQMSGDLVEFITAIDAYKRIHERPFPSWSEVLEIVKALGYHRAG